LRSYELMTIHRPELADADYRVLVRETEEFLRNRGSKILETDLWGKRRLAYEVKHLNEGYYSVLRFESEPDVVDDLDRVLGLSDLVIRHKIFHLNKK